MSKLWRISQQANSDYDTFDSAVVVADTADEARKIHPGGKFYQQYAGVNWWEDNQSSPHSCWAIALDQVNVQLLGEAIPTLQLGTVVCASFNAG
jgi:hypothetical protein